MRRRKTKSILCKDSVIEKHLFPQRFTRFYTLFYPRKKHSPLHMKPFCDWFSGDTSVKALISKCSPPLWRFYRLSADFQRFSGVKAYSFHLSQAFTARVNALLPLWTLWNQSLHTRNPCKLEENEHCVNGWILFSGNKKRIYVRVKRAFTKQISAFFSVIIPLRRPSRTRREVFFTSRRLFRTSPWVGKTSPWVGKTSPGLVGATPGLVGGNNLENNLFRTLLQKSTKKICSLVQKPYFCSRIPEGVLREAR